MKKELRKKIRLRVSLLSELDKAEASLRLCDEIGGTKEWSEASDVLLYMALPDEISLQPLLDQAYESGKRIWLPVVRGEELELRLFDPTRLTIKSKYKILEPTDDALVLDDHSKLSLALIPGRAFTNEGHRMGRGKGFYDRLLPQISCPKWGVGFTCQRVEEIPMDSWDVVLDCVYFA